MSTTTILLCRHGATDWNSSGKFQGTVDLPLNDEGIEHARRLARAMVGKGLSVVWTSPLIRAHETAKEIADTCRVPLRIDERLRARPLGILEGLPFREAAERYPVIWDAWKQFEPLPLDAEAESEELVRDRLESAFYALGAEYPGGMVAVVMHAGLMRCLLGVQSGGSVGNASITTIIVGPNRTWRLVEVDDASHLSALSEPLLPMRTLGTPITTVMLCRHGESVGNKERAFQGTIDLPLSEVGRLQARALGQALKSLDLAALWSSPLTRAFDTAREIATMVGLEAKADFRLSERYLGKLQDVTFAEVRRRWPETWAAWRGYMPLPPEINAEPRPGVVERIEEVLFELAHRYPGNTVAIVIHGANGRCLLKRSIGNGSITELQVGPSLAWRVTGPVGSASHLPPELAADAMKASKL